VLIGQFGMALGELWQLNGRGGIASPPNALAIK
jgi:hypothetical protein